MKNQYNNGYNKAKAFWQTQEDCEINSRKSARLLIVLRMVLGTDGTC